MIKWWRIFSKQFPKIVFLFFMVGCATTPADGPPSVYTALHPLERTVSETFPITTAPNPPEAPLVYERIPPGLEPPKTPPASSKRNLLPQLPEIPTVYERVSTEKILRAPEGTPRAKLPPIPRLPAPTTPPPSVPSFPPKQLPKTVEKPRLPAGKASDKAPPSASSWKLTENREERHFSVSPRNSQLIVLEGLGWILQEGSVEYRLVERYPEGGNTCFAFLFSQVGEGELLFQRQDIPLQILHRQRIHLRLTDPVPQDLAQREDPLPLETGDISRPMDEGGDDWAFFAEALKAKDFSAFHDHRWRDFLAAGEGETEILLETAEIFWRRGEWEILAPLIKDLQRRTLPPWREDGLLILLGRFYDGGSPWRDEKLSLSYYSRLTEDFPSSSYWDEADKRVRYLRRHYFQIR